MKTISIRDLHHQTGLWVRNAAKQQIVVTERGEPRAMLVPLAVSDPPHRTLQDRRIQPAYAELAGKLAPPQPSADSTVYVAEDRERR